MNRLLSLSLLLLLALIAPYALAQTPTPEPAPATELSYALGVDGMSCPLCVYGLEKQLHRLDGVDTVATDLNKGRVRIGMHEGKALDQPRVQQAVRDAGFTLRSFAPLPTDPGP